MEKNPKYPTLEEERIRFKSRFYIEGKDDTSAAWTKITRALHKQPSSQHRITIYRLGIASSPPTDLLAGLGYHLMNTQASTIIIAAKLKRRN